MYKIEMKIICTGGNSQIKVRDTFGKKKVVINVHIANDNFKY